MIDNVKSVSVASTKHFRRGKNRNSPSAKITRNFADTAKKIASAIRDATLDIAGATVKVHMKSVLRKVRVANRTQAATWALENGYAAENLHPELPRPEAIVQTSEAPRPEAQAVR